MLQRVTNKLSSVENLYFHNQKWIPQRRNSSSQIRKMVHTLQKKKSIQSVQR